jgi:hypothetical protein
MVMMARLWKTLLVVAVCGELVSLLGPARACNVPVFRYALEHWATDPYEVFVFHRGPLSATDLAAVALLEKAAPGLTLRTVDLAAQPDEALRDLFETQQTATLPWLLVRYPAATRVQGDAWAGPLQADTVRMLLDSPTRREIARRLLAGDSVVWVLLESGAREQDDAAARLLQSQLGGLQETMHLPPQTDPAEETQGPLARVPLRLAFSVVRVSRTDPAEALLVELLLHTEPDLAAQRGPLVFPIFGRGRVLYALVGAGITADNVREAAHFLTGACSCQVKQENPGVDLLMTADWSAGPLQVGPSSVPSGETAPNPDPEPSAEPPSLGMIGLVGLLLALAGITAAVYFPRRMRLKTGARTQGVRKPPATPSEGTVEIL